MLIFIKREIKFRVWLENKKEMIYGGDGFYIDGFTGEVYMPEAEKPFKLNRVNGVGIMQFTGLKDKNGKEIYEGDIMCFRCEKHNENGSLILGTCDFYPENSVQIIFKNGRFLGESKKGFSREMYDLLDTKYIQWEVIGNIYENPELLK